MLKNDQMRHTFKTAVMSGHIVRMMVAPDALAAKIAEDSALRPSSQPATPPALQP